MGHEGQFECNFWFGRYLTLWDMGGHGQVQSWVLTVPNSMG